MIYVFGTRMYGKVDQVPGLFHVSTQFAHLNFIPLFPIKSWLVFDSTMQGNAFRGIPLGWHGKSIFFAWLRFGSFTGGIAALIAAAIFGVEVLDRHKDAVPTLVVCAVLAPLLFLLLGFSYKLSSAGPMRALKIASRHGIKPEALAQFFADKLRPEEEERLAEYARAQAEQEPPTLEPAD
jgi:hypothetical protein